MNKDIFPRDTTLAEETDKFSVWSQLPEELALTRRYIVDSGASCHLVSWKDLTPKERLSVRKAKKPQHLNTANGLVHADHVVSLYSKYT